MTDEEIARALREEIPTLTAAYRFGSTVEGSERSDSDIDLAFLADHRMDALDRFAIQERLALRLHQDVDLVDLGHASTVMRMQVVSRGRLLLDRNPVAREVFEDYVFSSYARLNEERRAILDQIAREGRVYDG